MARTFHNNCYVLVIFYFFQLGSLQKLLDNTVPKLTEDESARKSTTIFDYHTRMSAYKDLIGSGCYIEFIKPGEKSLSERIREFPLKKLPEELYISEEKLSKRRIWDLAGPRIWEFCRGFPTYLIQEVKKTEVNDDSEDNNDIMKTRIRRKRRSTRHYFVGRLRGQTQSQYLNFGNANNSNGKAEAESEYGGSRATVVGTNGMGQAQSQSSPFDCEECYRPIKTSSEYEPSGGRGFPPAAGAWEGGSPGQVISGIPGTVAAKPSHQTGDRGQSLGPEYTSGGRPGDRIYPSVSENERHPDVWMQPGRGVPGRVTPNRPLLPGPGTKDDQIPSRPGLQVPNIPIQEQGYPGAANGGTFQYPSGQIYPGETIPMGPSYPATSVQSKYPSSGGQVPPVGPTGGYPTRETISAGPGYPTPGIQSRYPASVGQVPQDKRPPAGPTGGYPSRETSSAGTGYPTPGIQSRYPSSGGQVPQDKRPPVGPTGGYPSRETIPAGPDYPTPGFQSRYPASGRQIPPDKIPSAGPTDGYPTRETIPAGSGYPTPGFQSRYPESGGQIPPDKIPSAGPTDGYPTRETIPAGSGYPEPGFQSRYPASRGQIPPDKIPSTGPTDGYPTRETIPAAPDYPTPGFQSRYPASGGQIPLDKIPSSRPTDGYPTRGTIPAGPGYPATAIQSGYPASVEQVAPNKIPSAVSTGGYPTGTSYQEGQAHPGVGTYRPSGGRFGGNFGGDYGSTGRFSGQFSGVFDINGHKIPPGQHIYQDDGRQSPGHEGSAQYPASYPEQGQTRPTHPTGPYPITRPTTGVTGPQPESYKPEQGYPGSTRLPTGPPRGPGYGIPAGTPREPGYGIPAGTSREPGYGIPTGSSREPGYYIPTGPPREPGYDIPTGTSREPGYGIPTAPSREPGYGIPTGISTQPGYGIPTGPAREPGYGIPTGTSREPGYGIPTGPSREPGYYIPTGPPREPGYSIPTGASREPGYYIPTGPPREPGNGIPTGTSREPGYGIPTGSSREPGYYIPTGPPREPGNGIPAGPSIEPGYGIPTAPSREPGYGTPTGPSREPGNKISTGPSREPGYGIQTGSSSVPEYGIPTGPYREPGYGIPSGSDHGVPERIPEQDEPTHGTTGTATSPGGPYQPTIETGQEGGPNHQGVAGGEGQQHQFGVENNQRPGQYEPGADQSKYPSKFGTGSTGSDTTQDVNIPGTERLPSDGSRGDEDSQAQTSVQQINNETQASAQAQGKFQGGTAQSQVSGTYSGSGSFSASAGSDDGTRGALTQVSGGKQGAASAAQGRGGKGKSQAQMQLFSDTGKILSAAQSGGTAYTSQTQVQGGEEGGMANAQSNGSGRTSSQAQIGFTPYKKDEVEDANQKNYFLGGGTASAQGGSIFGQSQSQIQGKFRYGIKYSGGAQAQSGDGSNRNTSFIPSWQIKPIDLIPQSFSKHETSNESTVVNVEQNQERSTLRTIPTSEIQTTQVSPSLKDEDNTEEYDYEENETEKPSTNKIITQTRDGQTQHILLPNMRNLDARVVQTRSDNFKERVFQPGETFQPGQIIPGTSGYRIPLGFRGKVKSVASPLETYAFGANSQAQSVTITPGTGRIVHEKSKSHQKHNEYRSGYTYEPYRYYFKSGENVVPNFVSISKSESGFDNPITGKRVLSTHYTQSSTCGLITHTCVFRNSQRICLPNLARTSNGLVKVC